MQRGSPQAETKVPGSGSCGSTQPALGSTLPGESSTEPFPKHHPSLPQRQGKVPVTPPRSRVCLEDPTSGTTRGR